MFVEKVRTNFQNVTTTAVRRYRREIRIYQAGTTNISFIICSERLICSPRRVASSCPPIHVQSTPSPPLISIYPTIRLSLSYSHAYTYIFSLPLYILFLSYTLNSPRFALSLSLTVALLPNFLPPNLLIYPHRVTSHGLLSPVSVD